MAMALARFKLKKANAPTKLATFEKQPSWQDLVTNITHLFAIPPENVIVSYIEKEAPVTLYNEEDLQCFYKYRGPSLEPIKFVVQDINVPDAAISSTWSKDSNLSRISKSNDKLDLFCWVLNGSKTPFSVTIAESLTVDCMKKAIKKAKEPELDYLAADSITLWKLSPPIPSDEIDVKLGHVQSPEEILGCVKLDTVEQLLEHFSSLPTKHIHIIVKLPPAVSRKRSLLPMEEDSHVTKRNRIAKSVIEKKWNIDGAICETDTVGCYYLDPGTQRESRHCLDAVLTCQFAFLWGAQASGKTTRLLWLQKELIEMGYQALYISFERIQSRATLDIFWKSFSTATIDACLELPPGSPPYVSSGDDFLGLFKADSWPRNVVLLIDEVSKLYDAEPSIRDEWLRAFHEIRNNNKAYAIRSVIAAGTFGIVNLNTSYSTPFNIANLIQNPYFTVEEVRKLFHEFAKDNNITIDNAIVEDIWAKSNGHPAMVCLCGRIVFKNLVLLLDSNSANISNQNWQRFPANELYNEISAYNPFSSMLHSLAQPQAAAAVALLRSSFVGFLDEVHLNDDGKRDQADFLTSEGALLKPDPVRPNYCMASPLIDGLIRNKLIPSKFPDAPSSVPLLEGKGLHVLAILIESLKFFDKALIRLAASRSYKKSKVKIPSAPDGHVPRESIYDTELMRILSNWLQTRFNWTVTGQWHLQTDMKKHRYTDILIKKEDSPTIVLELLATGDKNFVQSHIQKTPEYMALLSANEAWVVHFTCERDYHPIWQSKAELLGGVNVVHFIHDLDFTNVVMKACWKDSAGNFRNEAQELTV